MEKSLAPTLEQLEQNLSQRVIVLFQTYLGHQPNKVTCKLAERSIAIVAEDSITRLEKFLSQSNRYELAKQVRATLLKALEPEIKLLIEEVVKVPVVDVIYDSGFETGRTSIVAVLAATPNFSS
ncbi:MAG TPA: hypothetical protein DEV81_23700 [Cyanobacteria bacterium UBA11049]|nr:hypothetical protein [Cyanobacteria bacterium UBA11049]